MSSEFDYQINTVNGVTFVTVQGFLDAHTYESMRDVFNRLFDEDHKKIAVDLHEVAYISSAGAGVFIGALERSQEIEGEIVLMKPSETVLEVFEMLGLTQIFQFAESRQQVLDHFGAG